MRDTQRERQRHRQREKQAPCREPDVGLYPGSPESCPGLQAALNHCATGATQDFTLFFFLKTYLFIYDREREAEIQEEEEAGSMLGA